MEDFLAEYRRSDLEAARAYTRRYARTFYFASFMLPKAKREAAYVIYAFCRYVDNILDDELPIDAKGRLERLSRLQGELGKVYSEGPCHPRLSVFRQIVFKYGIGRQHFEDLIKGVGMDLECKAYPTWKDLELYCYRVASVVGLMMARVFGVSSEDATAHAVDLGKAMQLTNILRDVREDFERGRIYLPEEDLARFGCSAEDLAGGRVSESFRGLMTFEISRARDLYRRGNAGIRYLTQDGSRFCAAVMSSLYERILDVIERNRYDVFRHRAAVPFVEKVAELIRLKWSVAS